MSTLDHTTHGARMRLINTANAAGLILDYDDITVDPDDGGLNIDGMDAHEWLQAMLMD